MRQLSTMSAEHRGVRAGYPVSGFGIDMKTLFAEGLDAVGHISGRSFGVHSEGRYIGTVYCMTGSRYAAFDVEKNEVSTHVGHDSEIKCFIDLVLSAKPAA